MKKILSLSLIAILTAAVGIFALASQTSSQKQACSIECLNVKIQAALDKAREEHDLPGLTAAYTLPNGDIYSFSNGYENIENQTPMRNDSRIMSGSIGKMFTAASILSLVDEKVLKLDDPISKWLGQEEWFDKLPNANGITLRMLLNHSSGLRDHVYLKPFSEDVKESLKDPNYIFPPEKLVSYLFGTTALFKPGEGYGYSDTGYILLGMIAEKATGQPYNETLQQKVIYPLNLSLTSPSAGRIHAGLAQGYIDQDNSILPDLATTMQNGVYRFNPASEWTGGGLVTNAKDLAKWIHVMFNGNKITANISRQMLDTPNKINDKISHGLGTFIYDTEFGPLYGHGGWFLGYRSFVAYAKDHRISVAVQCNTDKYQPSYIARDLLTLIIENFPDE